MWLGVFWRGEVFGGGVYKRGGFEEMLLLLHYVAFFKSHTHSECPLLLLKRSNDFSLSIPPFSSCLRGPQTPGSPEKYRDSISSKIGRLYLWWSNVPELLT